MRNQVSVDCVYKLRVLTSFFKQLKKTKNKQKKTPAENRCTASQETQEAQEFPPRGALSVELLPP